MDTRALRTELSSKRMVLKHLTLPVVELDLRRSSCDMLSRQIFLDLFVIPLLPLILHARQLRFALSLNSLQLPILRHQLLIPRNNKGQV